MINPKEIKIYVRDKRTKQLEEITDLYWFEEQGVQWFDGEGHFKKYDIEIFISGQKVWP